MRSLVLTHVFPRSEDDPSAPFLLTWARAVREEGVDLAVLAPHDAGLPVRHQVGGVPVRRVRYGPEQFERLAYRGEMHQIARRPFGPPLVAGLLGAHAAALRAQVRAGRPDVVHAHWWLPGAIIARLARLRVPVVVTLHGTDVALAEQRPALARAARWALAGAARVEAVSQDLADRVQAVTGRTVDAVNPMPLRADWLGGPLDPPAPAAAVRVLGIGRLVPEKGFADLVMALARLQRPVELELIGDGPERDRLDALARRQGVAVRFAGAVPHEELMAAYARADLVAQPSHREGFGLVAAEALVLGIPVVATDSGGVRELLPSVDLVAPGDVEALAGRLSMVAGNLPAARAHAAAHGGRLREGLSPRAAATRTVEGYRAVV